MPKFWTACGYMFINLIGMDPLSFQVKTSLFLSAVDLFPAANPKLVGKITWFVQKHRLERVQSPPMDIDGYGDDCIKNSSKKKSRNLGENTNVMTRVFRGGTDGAGLVVPQMGLYIHL